MRQRPSLEQIRSAIQEIAPEEEELDSLAVVELLYVMETEYDSIVDDRKLAAELHADRSPDTVALAVLACVIDDD